MAFRGPYRPRRLSHPELDDDRRIFIETSPAHIAGGVDVPMDDKAARAPVLPLGQGFRHRPAASGAVLARSSWVSLDQPATSLRSFVARDLSQGRRRTVEDAPVEAGLCRDVAAWRLG